MRCIKALFIDLDGTVWDHHDISSLEPPYRLIDRDLAEDQHGVRVRLMPEIRTLLAEAKKLGIVIAALSWNVPERAIEALKSFNIIDYFDKLYIEPHPHKGVVMARGLEELGIAPSQALYVDDRDIHIDEIRRLVGDVLFVQFGKDVRDHLELLRIVKRVACFEGASESSTQ